MISRFFLILTMSVAPLSFAQDDLYHFNWAHLDQEVASTVTYSDAVNEIYAQRKFQLIWHEPKTSQSLEALLTIITYAEISDFFSARLLVLRKLRDDGLWYEYDVVATDTLLNFVNYTNLVRENGFDWYYGGRVELPQIPLNSYVVNDFIRTVEKSALVEYVTALNGTPEQMDVVIDAIALLTEAMESGLPKYAQAGIIRPGDGIYNKKQLFDRLKVVGIDVDAVQLDSMEYDKPLIKAVKQFQKMHGLKVDGIIGKETLFWVNMPLEQRLRMIALNTERSRLMPKDLNNTVIVNLPSFHLYYWYQGKPEFSSKVIVGKKKRKTPLLRVKMDTLIMNPSWNVPNKLVREDIIPLIKKDEGYLERMNMKIVKNWSTKEIVDPSTIDWQTLDPDTFSYNMTQAPGKRNALGAFKFNTPNARAIYLHDTPSKYLFNKTSRAYSSGCIRVQYADKFAQTLMKVQGIEPPKQSTTEDLTMHRVALKRHIPVHILYQTAWIKNGLVQYRKDIYGYDYRASDLNLTKN
ncbi:L,D-transpeptidase family protein [Vibrio algarum]|uniref:L,D-transpeptidase family protein n=1 Tax=Vibrio algarum TaxID=3020714 RepID=A0ABT4YQC2_9VIBR|nr:L,D-transpeptidase family protein [Vibrio sp. KJ40-1]MDB1123761.1 L,D-transpeptidase family protein [Vibrio sp. KJ40-1]